MSLGSFFERMKFEIWLGFSHECNECGRSFRQNEDGCPYCGAGASVSLLNQKPVIYEKLDPKDNGWCKCFHDEISGSTIFLSANSSKEIRFLDDADDAFLYWIVIINDEPWYVFPGDSCLWPKYEI